MLATVLADLLARRLVEHSIMTEKLARRGVSVPGRTTPIPSGARRCGRSCSAKS